MLVALLSLVGASAGIVNLDVSRRYQIQDNLISVFVTLEIANRGEKSVSDYTYQLTEREAEHVGIVIASYKRKLVREIQDSLPVKRDGRLCTVHLERPLNTGDSVTIYLTYTLGNYCLFVKPTVQLNQKIALYFNTTLFYKGVYPTERSSLSIDGISKSSITKKTDHPSLKLLSSSLKITGLTEDTDDDFEVEFTTPKALPQINKVFGRTIVSHWGKSKQRTFYDISNAGPKFVGEFNRIDFVPNTSPCYLQTVTVTPPAESSDFWASDESGQLQKHMSLRFTELDIPLRGPMMSSWKATFTVGWTVNTSVFVTRHEDGFRFSANLLTPTIEAPITEAIADFILPEGAVIRNVNLPIDANVTRFIEVQNLDLNGREVVHIEVSNIASTDVIPVTIDYTLDSTYNFMKIGLLGAAFCVIFVAIAVCRRIDCTINVAPKRKEKDE